MVQLHVATELQLDYTTDQPFQLPKASVSAPSAGQARARVRQNRNKSHHAKEAVVAGPAKGLGDAGPISPPYPGAATAMNPQLAVVVDNDGLLTIFYDTFYGGPVDPKLPPDIDTEIRYMYQLPDFSWRQEVIPPPWPAGRNPQGRFGIKAAREPISGHIHLIYAYRIWPTKTLAHLELGAARFPKWTTMDCDNQNFDPTLPPASPIFDIGDFDVGFDTSRNLVVAVTLTQPLPAPWPFLSAGNFLWYPATNTVSYFGLEQVVPVDRNYDSLRYGAYPTPPARMSPNYGVIFHSVQTDEPDSIKRILLDTPGATIEFVTEAPHTGMFRSLAWFFLEDASTAPLGFVLDDNSAYFIYNCSGQDNISPKDNLRQIFADLPSGRYPLQINGVAVLPDAADDANSAVLDSLDVHAFGLFQCPDNTFELWHTRSVPGGAVQVSDGVIDVPVDNWSKSTVITKDIYSIADGLTSWLSPPFFTSLVVGNEPTCFVVSRNRYIAQFQRESESTNWVQTVISGQHVGMIPQVQTEKIFYVDITALDENFSPLAGTPATIGADSPMILACAGVPHFVDAGHTFNMSFNTAGKLGVSLLARDTLIPSSFWIRADGMDDGARVDIQPGPNGLHDTLQNLGLDKQHPSLRDVRDQNGNLVVPSSTPDQVVEHAQAALKTLSKVITGDNTPQEEEAERRHVKRTTPLTVARTRIVVDRRDSRFYRLRPIPGLAFAIRFSNEKPEFVILTKQQAAARRAAIRAGVDAALGPSNGFWDDIGDFFSDVGNAVVSVVEIVVEAVDEGYEATIHFVEDTINKALDTLLEFASEAASVAGLIFDWVKTTFETLYYWLAFIFDYKAIKATADAFEDYIQAAGPNLEVFIENTVKVATDEAYQKLRGEVDGFFDNMIAQFGTQTVSDYSPPIPVDIAAKDDPRVRRLAAMKEDTADVGSPISIGSISDLLTIMPSSSSWLLEKIIGHVTDSDEPNPDDAGVLAFGTALSKIEDNVVSVFSSPDFKAASDALVSFVESMTSPEILSGAPIASLLKLFKAFALIVLDLLHAVLESVIEMFRFTAQAMGQIFNAPVDNPVIQLIYWTVTGGDTLSWGSLCAFVIAIPHTILCKIITGVAPYGPSVEGEGLMSLHDEFHLANGIFNLLRPIFLGFKAAGDIIQNDPTFGQDSWFTRFVKQVGELYNGVVSAIIRLTNPPEASDLLSATSPTSSSTPADVAADVFILLQFIVTIADTLGSNWIRKNRLGTDISEFRAIMASVNFLFGAFGSIASAIAFDTGSIGKRETEVLVGNVFTCLNTAMDLVDKEMKTPDQKGYVWLIRTAMCFTAGALYIAASQESDAGAEKGTKEAKTKQEVEIELDLD